MYRWQPSAALPLSTRVVTASELDVLVTHLAIPRAGAYDRIGRPVVHDILERFHASRHGQAQCMTYVLSDEARPERRVVGVTRLGPNGVFMSFDLALSNHCGFFRASVRRTRSLLEHPQLTRWSLQREENDQLVDAERHVEGRCTCVLWSASNIELV